MGSEFGSQLIDVFLWQLFQEPLHIGRAEVHHALNLPQTVGDIFGLFVRDHRFGQIDLGLLSDGIQNGVVHRFAGILAGFLLDLLGQVLPQLLNGFHLVVGQVGHKGIVEFRQFFLFQIMQRDRKFGLLARMFFLEIIIGKLGFDLAGFL